MAADWDLRQLQLHLDKKSPLPVYFLYGEEGFLVEQALGSIKKRVLVEGAQDFNYDTFYAPESSPSVVRDVVETLPLLCERRLVVYKNIDTLKDEAWEDLSALFDRPSETATLVLVGTKVDKRKKIIKKIQKSAPFVELKKPYDNQIPMWIDYIAYLNEVVLTRDAALAVQQLVGTNLHEINNEIKKIKQYLSGENKDSDTKGDSKNKLTIELQHVLDVVSRARVENVFNLTDAIARRDKGQALMCLANLLDQGQSEVGVVALIHRQIRILSAVEQGRRDGLGGQRLAQKVGVPEFFMKQYLEQARLWDKEMLTDATKALQATDKAIKSSPISAHIWLENFILKTC